tara:strand:- start:569 stop:850 length:282 start_codon:yes stop_codon:yes gene_type:complete
VVRLKLRLQQTVVTAQILYLQPSLQQVAVKVAAQLPARLVRLEDRAAGQEMVAHQELLALAQQIKVLQVAHQPARREITVVPVAAVQVLRLQV